MVIFFIWLGVVAYPIYFMSANFRKFNFNLGVISILCSFIFLIPNTWTSWTNLGFALVTIGGTQVYVWRTELKLLRKRKKGEEDREKAAKKYDEIQEFHGGLYEKTERPLTPDEIAKFRKGFAQLVWLLVPFILAGLVGSILIEFRADPEYNSYKYGTLLFSVITGLILLIAYKSEKRKIENNKMYVLKAVVSEKGESPSSTGNSTDFHIVLGDKEDEKTYRFIVEKEFYDNTKYGDVIMVEGLSPRFTEFRNMVYLGSIMGHGES